MRLAIDQREGKEKGWIHARNCEMSPCQGWTSCQVVQLEKIPESTDSFRYSDGGRLYPVMTATVRSFYSAVSSREHTPISAHSLLFSLLSLLFSRLPAYRSTRARKEALSYGVEQLSMPGHSASKAVDESGQVLQDCPNA